MAVEGQRFMTKTQHYRKVTKPLLERKRRARMNLYLDELKDLIVDTMDAQGEQVSKLEKADILELTVNYLKAQQQQRAATPISEAKPPLNFDKFRAGYTQAAYEVSHIFSTVPGLDLNFGTHLMKQLGHQLKDMKQQMPEICSTLNEEPSEPVNLSERRQRSLSPHDAVVDANALDKGDDVWRPW
ncbi:enhancer of split mdelta protein [Scaptodrosophila lebanonensis]|uniref:Enhancer of split mdelta protein n=1 Tax=Drosophila lebanonensis TaxID=7225 RepID=A0A6J2TK17_DROLE|nr:enhancer of split mdelta protein [Scaptodrosophila lebanonensis]